MKVNKVVTKAVLRVFFILVLVAAFPFIHGDQSKFQHIYFSYHNYWQLTFPAIIIIGFLILLVMCAIRRYENTELNWLLVVNTIIVTAYGVAIFIKVSSMI